MSRVLVPLVVMSFNTAIRSLHFFWGVGGVLACLFFNCCWCCSYTAISYLGKMGQCYTSMERQPPPVSQY